MIHMILSFQMEKKNPSIIHLASDALGTMKLRILIPKLYKTDNPNVCRGI